MNQNQSTGDKSFFLYISLVPDLEHISRPAHNLNYSVLSTACINSDYSTLSTSTSRITVASPLPRLHLASLRQLFCFVYSPHHRQLLYLVYSLPHRQLLYFVHILHHRQLLYLVHISPHQQLLHLACNSHHWGFLFSICSLHYPPLLSLVYNSP